MTPHSPSSCPPQDGRARSPAPRPPELWPSSAPAAHFPDDRHEVFVGFVPVAASVSGTADVRSDFAGLLS